LRRARRAGPGSASDYRYTDCVNGTSRLSKGLNVDRTRRSFTASSSPLRVPDSVGALRRASNSPPGAIVKSRDAFDQMHARRANIVLDKRTPASAMGVDDRVTSEVGCDRRLCQREYDQSYYRSHCTIYAMERRYFERVKESYKMQCD